MPSRFRRLSTALMIAFSLVAAGCASQQTAENLGAGLPAGAGAPGSTQEFQVTVGDRVFFDTDSTALDGAAQAILDRQAQWLGQYAQYGLTIEGHADERGTREYNLALGARRASAVRDYLIARGVGASRIRTVSYGKERPVEVCDNISCWSKNRRAVTVLDGASS
jgi:peptidoglycan-associated lipoprotein